LREKGMSPPSVSKKPNQLPLEPPSEYGLINVTWRGDNLVLVERTEHGVVIRQRRAEYSCFLKAADVDAKVAQKIRSHPMVTGYKDEGDWKRVYFRDQRVRESLCLALDRDGLQTYEGDVNPVRRYMTDNVPKLAIPRVCQLDIETDSRVPIRKAAEGNARILCWTVVCSKTGATKVGVLEEDTDVAERALLLRLYSVLESFDLVTAWNGDKFDFQVIRERARRRRINVNFDRWLWLDQMELFIRMNTGAAESGEEKQSFALQAIATAVLGEGKDDFDSSKTWEAWAAGGDQRIRLVRYCVKDTVLLRKLEEKTGFIGLLQTLAETCNVFPDSKGVNPTVQAEGFLLKLASSRNYRFPSNFHRGYSEQFKGAYVMEPRAVGIVKGVHVGDFASLYPSIIVTWNMSPETLVTGDEAADLEVVAAHGGPIEQAYSWAPITGRFFRTDEVGILPLAVLEVVGLRKYWNDLKATFPPGSEDWVRANRKAAAYKIAANSFYGIVGSPMSRFFNRAVAEAVTQAGAWLIHETIAAAEERYGMQAIYGDTDSLFIAGCTETHFEVFVEWANKELYPEKLTALGCKRNLIKLAYEKEFERVIFCSAKKYIGRYAHYKGTRANASSKPEIKGLEYKRGDSIRLARQFQGEVIDLLVGMTEGGVEDPEVFAEVTQRWQDRVLRGELELDDVVISKRLNKDLREYARKRKADGTWGKQLPHVELARQLHEQGDDVSEGTKISYFLFDASKRGDTVFRTAAEWNGECDRFEVWEKLTWPPTQRLLSAAFPEVDWTRFSKVRPKAPRVTKPRKGKAKGGGDAEAPQDTAA
jgi:DNA polymerase elongation subunit (family B)